MKAINMVLLGITLLVVTTAASAQKEQYIPVLSYRVGPYAAGGSGYYGGAIDYWTLVNMSGGVNGVNLKWEECETEYNASKGVEGYERLKKNYGGAAKHFKKAVALDESHSTYHVNLGAAWFSQKKFERAISEYVRALELNPDAFNQESKVGIAAQILSPEERAQYAFSLVKAYAKRGDMDNSLQCLKKAKEEGYRNMANVYKDEEFSHMRDNPRLHEVVPPPTNK